MCMCSVLSLPSIFPLFQSNKRMHMEVDSEMSTTETTNDAKTTDKVEKDITDLNLPIPDETATACLITVSLTCEVFQNLN